MFSLNYFTPWNNAAIIVCIACWNVLPHSRHWIYTLLINATVCKLVSRSSFFNSSCHHPNTFCKQKNKHNSQYTPIHPSSNININHEWLCQIQRPTQQESPCWGFSVGATGFHDQCRCRHWWGCRDPKVFPGRCYNQPIFDLQGKVMLIFVHYLHFKLLSFPLFRIQVIYMYAF